MRTLWPWIALALLVGVAAWGFAARRQEQRVPAGPGTTTPAATVGEPTPTPARDEVTVVAEGLEVPWALAFASPRAESRGPDLYVTERPGRLSRIRDGKADLVAEIPEARQTAEGGLLGLALDPAFAENQFLYLYYSYRATGSGTLNRVVRYRLTDGGIVEPKILLDAIPGAAFHDGGRLKFGPDGMLYITTGDAGQETLATQVDSLAGKILRLRPDGSIPPDNPIADNPSAGAVYSYGHRNPQGLAWATDGTLWSTEHGPSGPGADCCHDEVNRIVPFGDYGWPFFAGRKVRVPNQYDTGRPEFPWIESGPKETWAPASAAIAGNTLFFGGLRGEALFAVDLTLSEEERLKPEVVRRLFEGRFGRIRDVVVGPDGMLYLTTSNRDGRGRPRPGDDKILRVDPATLSSI